MTPRIPAVVLGGTGYVAGELLRLLAAHPHFALAGVLSDSQPGRAGRRGFRPSGRAPIPSERFKSQAEIEAHRRARAVAPRIFSAAPHGAAAALIDALLTSPRAAGRTPHVVDISADFRYPRPRPPTRRSTSTRTVRRRACRAFTCAVPEHLRELRTPHVAHPGCFATATLLAVGAAAERSELTDAGAVRHRRHRQHRLGPQARARARIIRCGTAISTPTTRWRTGTRPRSAPARSRPPASRPSSPSCRTPDRSRAAFMPRCRRAAHTAATARRCWRRCASSMPARRSCACSDARAAHEGSRRAATTRTSPRSATAAPWR